MAKLRDDRHGTCGWPGRPDAIAVHAGAAATLAAARGRTVQFEERAVDDLTQRYDPPKPVELRLLWDEWVPAHLHYWHRGHAGRWVGGITFLSAGAGPPVTSCVSADRLREPEHP